MQQLIGRLTNNAKVAHLQDGREVVNFSIAMNDSYKSKGSNEPTKIVTYVDCAYWLSSKIAAQLTKGSLVEVYGRIGVRAYMTIGGEAKGSLICHVSSIKMHGSGKSTAADAAQQAPVTEKQAEDDLPF